MKESHNKIWAFHLSWWSGLEKKWRHQHNIQILAHDFAKAYELYLRWASLNHEREPEIVSVSRSGDKLIVEA